MGGRCEHAAHATEEARDGGVAPWGAWSEICALTKGGRRRTEAGAARRRRHKARGRSSSRADEGGCGARAPREARLEEEDAAV